MTTTPASTFRQLHEGPEVLLLANCWDAGTARLIASLGARAIATSSAAVAWSQGYPDGDALPVDLLLATVRSIARILDVPLTVDVEAGYSDDPATVADTIAAVIDAGAAGINLEDGSAAPELLAAKITHIKRAAARRGADLFINARTDVYLRALVPAPARVAETLTRAALYRDAGADGLFVPCLIDPTEIRAITSATTLPINLLARPGLPPAAALAALGVRRLSVGSALAQSQWARMTTLARAFLAGGGSDAICEGGVSHGEINARFVPR